MKNETWALVTGASSGIGKEYATLLAEQGINCVLVARREDMLKELSQKLQNNFKISTLTITLDLSVKENCYKLFEECNKSGIFVDYLINNAGSGLFDLFQNTTFEAQEKMINLNIIAPTLLTHLFLPKMLERNKGHIQLVASIASFIPTPFYATYGASKAYIKNFGVALNYELQGTNVHCSVINPGLTETEFFQVAGQKHSWLQKLQMMSAKRCANIALNALQANRNSVLPGLTNWFTGNVLVKFVPLRLQAKVIYDDLVKSNGNK